MDSTVTTASHLSVRRWERCRADIPVLVIVQHEKKVLIVNGKGKSLSDGGMALFVGTELTLGRHVAVEFTPPYSSLPIRLDATICTRTGYSYGLEFRADTATQNPQAAEFRKQLSILKRTKGDLTQQPKM